MVRTSPRIDFAFFRVPQDFDADDEAQRDLVAGMLGESVARDILMNIVFGNLAAEDVRFFVRTSGLPGLHLALLHEIAMSREDHVPSGDLADRLGVSPGAVRERLLRLLGCGFVDQFGGGASLSHATLKGRVFLDLCGQLQRQAASGLEPEMLQILRLLEMRYAPSAVERSARALRLAGPLLTEVPEMVTGRLLATIAAAADRWGIRFDPLPRADRRHDGGTHLRGIAVHGSSSNCATRATARGRLSTRRSDPGSDSSDRLRHRADAHAAHDFPTAYSWGGRRGQAMAKCNGDHLTPSTSRGAVVPRAKAEVE